MCCGGMYATYVLRLSHNLPFKRRIHSNPSSKVQIIMKSNIDILFRLWFILPTLNKLLGPIHKQSFIEFIDTAQQCSHLCFVHRKRISLHISIGSQRRPKNNMFPMVSFSGRCKAAGCSDFLHVVCKIISFLPRIPKVSWERIISPCVYFTSLNSPQ